MKRAERVKGGPVVDPEFRLAHWRREARIAAAECRRVVEAYARGRVDQLQEDHPRLRNAEPAR